MKWKAPHYPGHPLRGRGGGVSNDWCINPLFKFMQKTPICFSITSNANTKNEIEIRFPSDAKTKHKKRNSNPFFKVMRKRKTKTEIQIPFSKCGENEKRNSNPFFNVTSWQKTKNRNGNEIPFHKAEEKRKISEWNLNAIFFMPSKNGWR